MALAAWAVSGRAAAFLVALLAVALILPTTATYRCPAGWPRQAMGVFTVSVAAAGLGAAATTLVPAGGPAIVGQVGRVLLGLCAAGVFLSSWVANILISMGSKGESRARR